MIELRVRRIVNGWEWEARDADGHRVGYDGFWLARAGAEKAARDWLRAQEATYSQWQTIDPEGATS